MFQCFHMVSFSSQSAAGRGAAAELQSVICGYLPSAAQRSSEYRNICSIISVRLVTQQTFSSENSSAAHWLNISLNDTPFRLRIRSLEIVLMKHLNIDKLS